MLSIFFDLETTDKEPIGQIINYCFITVDENWQTVSSLVGDVKISRLQLPQAGAILANRTNVLEHQKRNPLSEYEAMQQIVTYVSEVISKSEGEKAFLIGYNSTRFDIPYLRTSLIRNGFNPYFAGKLVYRDLLHIVRKLACFEEEFPRTAASETTANTLSLTLETTTKNLNLLDGEQKHHSLADVELTIILAKYLAEHFEADVRSSDTYLPTSFRRGDLGVEYVPNYDLTLKARAIEYPVMLLDNDYRYALWVDLDKFKANPSRDSIIWCNKAQAAFFCLEAKTVDAESIDLAEKAKQALKDINLKNFFSPSTCDIEQDIYRMDMVGIDALAAAIKTQDKTSVENCREAKILFLRHVLANYTAPIFDNPTLWNIYKKYIQYRYAGQLQLRKQFTGSADDFCLTYQQQLAEIDKGLTSSTSSADDLELLNALKTFYLTSDVKRALEE